MKIFYELTAKDPSVELVPSKYKAYSIDSKEMKDLKEEIFILKYNNGHLIRKLDEKLQQKMDLQQQLNTLTMQMNKTKDKG